MPAIYQADVWCNECANKIRDRLRSQGSVPPNINDECDAVMGQEQRPHAVRE